ncbi:MAG TPA: hypothetical protein DEQ28_08540 [Clostridiales bacterium]|nr:hypothetical protein [Clostridiales bacterium]
MRTVLIVVAALVVLGVGAAFWFNRGMGAIRRLTIEEPDLTALADGVYQGRFQQGRWLFAVEVTVADHRVQDIRVTRSGLEGRALSQALVREVVGRQSLQVDTVSGATISTRAFLKAVENALRP